MRKLPLLLAGAIVSGLFAACTEHRRDTAPTPDGDTIEVKIEKPQPDLDEVSDLLQDNNNNNRLQDA